MPLLVDAAWGAHYGFHPALPPHALQAGADALVTSAHKMLTGYSQAALVLARTERIDPERLSLGFEAGNTTSPAGAVLASTDAAGIWTVQTGIFPENVPSLALHQGTGFRVLGTSERIGRSADGRWRDVVRLERRSPVVN